MMIVGSAIWLVSWICNGQTEDGAVAFLGLSEWGWRRLLDPATLLLMTGLLGFHVGRRQRYGKLGLVAFATTEFGLAVVLIGNVIEFWIGGLLYMDVPGAFEPSDHVGWAVFLAGLLVVLIGLVLVGVASARVEAPGGK